MEQNVSRDDSGGQFSSTDMLKKRTIDWVFEAGRMACRKQESIAEYTYETDFINAVKFAKSQLWKYTPEKIRKLIQDLYMQLEKDINEVDSKPTNELSDKNKILAKQRKAYEVSSQVLEMLFLVIQNSPLSVEFIEMEVKDYEALIRTIRSKDILTLFSGEADEPE